MKKNFKQSEIQALLLANPHAIKVNFDEENAIETNAIFWDWIGDVKVSSDNNAFYKSIIQLSIYCKNAKILRETCDFIKQHFVIEFEIEKDNDYIKAIGDVQLFIEWGV